MGQVDSQPDSDIEKVDIGEWWQKMAGEEDGAGSGSFIPKNNEEATAGENMRC